MSILTNVSILVIDHITIPTNSKLSFVRPNHISLVRDTLFTQCVSYIHFIWMYQYIISLLYIFTEILDTQPFPQLSCVSRKWLIIWLCLVIFIKLLDFFLFLFEWRKRKCPQSLQVLQILVGLMLILHSKYFRSTPVGKAWPGIKGYNEKREVERLGCTKSIKKWKDKWVGGSMSGGGTRWASSK